MKTKKVVKAWALKDKETKQIDYNQIYAKRPFDVHCSWEIVRVEIKEVSR